MVFSKILDNISDFFSPKTNIEYNNKPRNDVVINQLQQGMKHLENRKRLMSQVSSKLKLLENFDTTKLGQTSQKEIQYLQRLEKDYNADLSEYSRLYKDFMESYSKGVQSVKDCKSKCLVNHPRGSNAWSFSRQACQAGCDLKGPYVSKCKDTYGGFNNYNASTSGESKMMKCSTIIKNKCINGDIIPGMESAVNSTNYADSKGVTIKDGCCECGGGAGGPPSSRLRGRLIKSCDDVPKALGYKGGSGNYTRDLCKTAPLSTPQQNKNLFQKYDALVKKNDALILTAKEIFKHINNLNSKSDEMSGVMKKNRNDIRDNIDYYNTLKQQIDILERKSNDKTADGLMEDALLKEKSSYYQLILWSILAILTILLAIERIRK